MPPCLGSMMVMAGERTEAPATAPLTVTLCSPPSCRVSQGRSKWTRSTDDTVSPSSSIEVGRSARRSTLIRRARAASLSSCTLAAGVGGVGGRRQRHDGHLEPLPAQVVAQRREGAEFAARRPGPARR
jgi:hypothetical protein